MSVFLSWLTHVDSAWIGVIGVAVGAVVGGYFSSRAARSSARAAVEAALVQQRTQYDVTEFTAAAQSLTRQESAFDQLRLLREQHYTERRSNAYVQILEHVKPWSEYVERLRTLSMPVEEVDWIEKVEAQQRAGEPPPPIDAPPALGAEFRAYASESVLSAFGDWSRLARSVRAFGGPLPDNMMAYELSVRKYFKDKDFAQRLLDADESLARSIRDELSPDKEIVRDAE